MANDLETNLALQESEDDEALSDEGRATSIEEMSILEGLFILVLFAISLICAGIAWLFTELLRLVRTRPILAFLLCVALAWFIPAACRALRDPTIVAAESSGLTHVRIGNAHYASDDSTIAKRCGNSADGYVEVVGNKVEHVLLFFRRATRAEVRGVVCDYAETNSITGSTRRFVPTPSAP